MVVMHLVLLVAVAYYGDYNEIYLNPCDPGPAESGIRLGALFSNSSSEWDDYYWGSTDPVLKTAVKLYTSAGTRFIGITGYISYQGPGGGIFLASPRFKETWLSGSASLSYNKQEIWPHASITLWQGLSPDFSAYLTAGYGMGLGDMRYSLEDTSDPYNYITADTTYKCHAALIGLGLDYIGLENIGFTVGGEMVMANTRRAQQRSSGVHLDSITQEFFRLNLGLYLRR